MRICGVAFLLALTATGVGCSGSSASTTSVTGAVDGQSFSASASLNGSASLGGVAFLGRSTVVYFMDPAASAAPPTGPALYVALAVVGGAGAGESTPITKPGTYSIVQSSSPPSSPGSYADAVFEDCLATAQKSATPITKEASSGTVTIDVVDASHIAGSIDLDFGQDRIAGSFDAPSGLDLLVTPTPICQ